MPRTPNASCTRCGIEFYKRPSATRKLGDFCSKVCYAYWREESNYKTCPICSKEFHSKRREQIYCSLKCATSRPRSEKWNGRGKNFKRNIKDKLFVDGWNGECMVKGCHYKTTHDVHRLIPGRSGGKYEPENSFALCPNHHAEVHRGFITLEKSGDMELISKEKGPDGKGYGC